jgi:hypothetical protein
MDRSRRPAVFPMDDRSRRPRSSQTLFAFCLTLPVSSKDSSMFPTTIVSASTVVAVLFSLAPSANADLIATLAVNSPTELSVSLSGMLSGPAPSSFGTNITIDFGTENYSGVTQPTTITGGYSPFNASGTLFNNRNSIADSINVIFDPSPFTVGQAISGTAIFAYDTEHQLVAGQSFDLFWGASLDGTLQSSGVTTAVPEPSSLLMLGLGLSSFALRRRYSWISK